MKKLLSLIVACSICAGTFVFAEDAEVLPARTGRVTIAPTFTFANDRFDEDGKKESLGDGLKAFNLGAALEYGIIDWVTASVQWVPGWNIWSDAGDNPYGDGKATINGVYDLFVGAKVQIVGENAPIQSSLFRAAVAPGVVIPLPGMDEDKETENMMEGDDFIAANPDRHVFGFGARGYFDYIINEMFYINLYGEYMAFPIEDDNEVNYGWKLAFELEPHFQMNVVDGIRLSAGVPVNFKMTPDKKFDGTKQDDSGSYLLTLKPNISAFITTLPLPMEFELAYTLPLIGKNETAAHSISLLAKLYLKI